jgi:hypothetical protein
MRETEVHMKIVTRLLVVAFAVLALGAPAAAASATTTTGAAKAASPSAALDGLPANWVALGSGCFFTSDAQDYLCYEVKHGASSPAVVDFRLQGARACLWAKTLVMPDGLGSQWDIDIDPSRGVFANQNGLWAQQVQNGQHLSLWKAGFWGFKYKVLEIGDLGALAGGDKVVFTWLRDSASCHE